MIPGVGIAEREIILDPSSVGVGGEAHVCRCKGAHWASNKKVTLLLFSFENFAKLRQN